MRWRWWWRAYAVALYLTVTSLVATRYRRVARRDRTLPISRGERALHASELFKKPSPPAEAAIVTRELDSHARRVYVDFTDYSARDCVQHTVSSAWECDAIALYVLPRGVR